MELSEMVKRTRKIMKLSQIEYAKKIGTNQTEVSFIERGFIQNDKRKVEAALELYQEIARKY